MLMTPGGPGPKCPGHLEEGTPFEITAGDVWREGHGDLLYWRSGEWVLEWSGKNCAGGCSGGLCGVGGKGHRT